MKSLVYAKYLEPALCANLSTPILVAGCYPYIVRLVQCARVYRQTGNTSQLYNAAKYASAFPAIVLTAYASELQLQHMSFSHQGMWLAAMLLNSLYSFYWDIEMDWDMPWLVQQGVCGVGAKREGSTPWLVQPGGGGGEGGGTCSGWCIKVCVWGGGRGGMLWLVQQGGDRRMGGRGGMLWLVQPGGDGGGARQKRHMCCVHAGSVCVGGGPKACVCEGARPGVWGLLAG